MALTKVGVKGLDDGTDGQIITYDANGNPVAVGPGTDGQVLTSTGAGSPPAFEDIPAAGAALTGSTDNTICTVTGANAIQGEANLTYDGNDITQTIDADSEGVKFNAAGDHKVLITADADRAAADNTICGFRGKWDGTEVGRISFLAGADTTNKDDGHITFNTRPSGSGIAERFRIDSSGNVGINSTDPEDLLHIKSGKIRIENAIVSNNDSTISYDNSDFLVDVDPNNVRGSSQFQIKIDTVAALTVNDNRDVRIDDGHVRIDDGDLVIETAGHGINFHPHSGTANLLDDYEEGTWAPLLNANVNSYAKRYGHYTKIGNVVYVSIWIEIDSVGSNDGSDLTVDLPFASKNDSTYRGGMSFTGSVFGADSGWEGENRTHINYNTANMEIGFAHKTDTSTGWSMVVNKNDTANGTGFQISGTYLT